MGIKIRLLFFEQENFRRETWSALEGNHHFMAENANLSYGAGAHLVIQQSAIQFRALVHEPCLLIKPNQEIVEALVLSQGKKRLFYPSLDKDDGSDGHDDFFAENINTDQSPAASGQLNVLSDDIVSGNKKRPKYRRRERKSFLARLRELLGKKSNRSDGSSHNGGNQIRN